MADAWLLHACRHPAAVAGSSRAQTADRVL
eukprot:SAG25_NODE_14986_length_192_cov_4.354839_1_plen_29_part_10